MERIRTGSVELECGHCLTLTLPYPNLADLLWCVRCVEYQPVAPSKGYLMAISYHDGWKSTPIRWRVVRGECLYEGCRFENQGEWHHVRDRITLHIIREHTSTALVSRLEIVPIPSTEEPPF